MEPELEVKVPENKTLFCSEEEFWGWTVGVAAPRARCTGHRAARRKTGCSYRIKKGYFAQLPPTFRFFFYVSAKSVYDKRENTSREKWKGRA